MTAPFLRMNCPEKNTCLPGRSTYVALQVGDTRVVEIALTLHVIARMHVTARHRPMPQGASLDRCEDPGD